MLAARADVFGLRSPSRACVAVSPCADGLWRYRQERRFHFTFRCPGPFFSNLWMAGKRKALPDARLGDTFLFDLNENPTVDLDTPFELLRFYVPQNALDEMADELRAFREVKGLHTRQLGEPDLIMYRFAQALAGAMARPGDGSAMFPIISRSPFLSYRWRLWRLGDQTIRARRPGSVAAAPRLRIHRRQFG